jgi:D-alanine-D-alanine ligase-like ATP-grasp enzyme
MRPYQTLLAQAATDLGGSFTLDPVFRHLGQLTDPKGRTSPVFGNAIGLNSDAASTLAADKTYAAQRLTAAGLPTPPGCLVMSDRFIAALALKNRRIADAINTQRTLDTFLSGADFPLFIKPNRGSEGAGVSRIPDRNTLDTALADLLTTETHVRIEQAVPGHDYRILVLDGAVRIAYRRDPFGVTGDGQSTIDQLLQTSLNALAAQHRGAKLPMDDPRINAALTRQSLTRDQIPARCQSVTLLDNANLSTGGTLKDITDTLPPAAANMAIQATTALGLRLAGVDILARDLNTPTILEVNSAPGLDFYAATGETQNARAGVLVFDALSALWSD